MPRRPVIIARICLPAALLAWLTAGCAPATKPAATAKPAAAANDHGDHDHGHAEHAHPETMSEGIAELERVAADVAAKLADGAEGAADDAIHMAGHVVEDLKGLLAKQEGLADEAKAAGEQALADLFDAFDKIDQVMHSGAEDVKVKAAEAHESVKETIRAAVDALKERFPKEDK
jgi:hypothetical protein